MLHGFLDSELSCFMLEVNPLFNVEEYRKLKMVIFSLPSYISKNFSFPAAHAYYTSTENFMPFTKRVNRKTHLVLVAMI